MQYFKTAVLRRKAEQNGLVVYASAAIIKRKEPINVGLLATGYRLCVYASGSLITVVWNCLTVIRVSCLHLGQ